jgi:hypothetical protein
MRKLVLVAASVAALAVAGLAAARSSDNGKSITAVSGTFAATTVGSSQTRTCTTADGKSIASTKATYTGTASGSADLTGPITLETHSVVNTTDGVGEVDGKLKIAAASGDTVAHFATVYDHGNVAGLANGHTDSHAELVGNLSAGFGTTTGFSGGKLGGSTSGGSAVELSAGRCAPSKSTEEKSEATGTVSAVSATSITVAGLTCSVPASLAATLQNLNLKVGDRAAIHCTLSAGVTSLTKVETKH